MPSYITPGVYFESSDANAQRVNAIRTDIAAFVGVAERGPLNAPTPVRSWAQFASTFGGFIDGCYLAFAVKAFFENGGRLCYIVRCASASAKAAEVVLKDQSGQPTLRVSASSPGSWGSRVSVRVNYSTLGATRSTVVQPDDQQFSLVESVVGFGVNALVRIYQDHGSNKVCPSTVYRYIKSVDPIRRCIEWDQPLCGGFKQDQSISLETLEFSLDISIQGRLEQVYSRLSLYDSADTGGSVPADERPEHHAERVINLAPMALIRVEDLRSSAAYEQRLPARGDYGLRGGKDGLDDLSLEDLTGEPGEDSPRGLRSLENVDEVAIIAMPDLLMHAQTALPEAESETEDCPPLLPPPPQPRKVYEPTASQRPLLFSAEDIFFAQSRLVEHCELLKDRFALLDPPFLPKRDGLIDFGEIQGWRQRFDSSYAALYFPWVKVYDPLQPGQQLVQSCPPCGHVAGAYARSDLSTGVHQAPANQALNWVQDVSVEITPEIQGALNPIGVNCIRSFAGRGIRIYGARTVSSDPIWRYVNVRRLIMMIEEALEESCQYAVFEPNNISLRLALRMSISNFLTLLWQQGALNGARVEDAYQVICDETNNPEQLADTGQLVVDVLVAPVKPAEFVVIRIGRTQQELELSEGTVAVVGRN